MALNFNFEREMGQLRSWAMEDFGFQSGKYLEGVNPVFTQFPNMHI